MTDLAAIFAGLDRPSRGGDTPSFRAVPVPAFETHRVGKDRNGLPWLLLASAQDASRASPPIKLKNIEVHHNVLCQVESPGGYQAAAHFTLIGFRGQDLESHGYFLRAASALIAILGAVPTVKEIERGLEGFVEIFRLMSEPARGTVQGLWAELLMIARAADSGMLLEAWHRDPQELYDFSSGTQRVEVKSAARRERHHHFRYEQLRPPPSCKVIIASVIVQPSTGGWSVCDLWAEVRARPDVANHSELLARIDKVVAETLGSNWREGSTACFDRELAEQSIVFYDAADVPTIAEPPAEISDVHFIADLTHVPRTLPAELASAGGLFAELASRPMDVNSIQNSYNLVQSR